MPFTQGMAASRCATKVAPGASFFSMRSGVGIETRPPGTAAEPIPGTTCLKSDTCRRGEFETTPCDLGHGDAEWVVASRDRGDGASRIGAAPVPRIEANRHES